MTINIGRREVLRGAAAVSLTLAAGALYGARASTIARSPSGKALAGVFPIGWTPCTPDSKINFEAMAAQMRFLNKGRVAGIAWPQNASGWESISEQEWHDGADALTSVKGKSAVVLGVQTLGFDTAKSVNYAKAAKSKGADAIISIVPTGATDQQAIAYFKALSDASSLPMMVQAVGAVSVDSLVAISAAVPTLVAVKDEAGDPLERSSSLLARTGGKLEDFSGGGGHTFFPEMELGFLGTCPYAGLADVLQRSFDLYQKGNKRDSYDAFGRFLAFDSLPHANEYVMKARGVFAEDAIMRVNPPAADATPGGRRRSGPITEAQKTEIKLALSTYLKPYLVA
jgi:dihydrodipicolinate synthase/N-acetylneuraminate lyase